MIVIKEPDNIKKLCSLDFGTYFILANDTNEPGDVFMSMCARVESKSASYRYEYKVINLSQCEGIEQWMREDAEVIPIDITKMYVKES